MPITKPIILMSFGTLIIYMIPLYLPKFFFFRKSIFYFLNFSLSHISQYKTDSLDIIFILDRPYLYYMNEVERSIRNS